MKIKLKNITFKEFYELDDKHQYNYAGLYSNELNQSLDLFGIGEFTDLTFGTVKDMQHSFKLGVGFDKMIEFICDLKGLKKEEVVNYSFFDICKCRVFFESQLDRINNLELSLSYDAGPKDQAAGIDELAIFGVLIQIDELAHGKVWMHETIRALPYMRCFTKLLKDKRVNEYHNSKNKIG